MTKQNSMTSRARITASLGILALAVLAACGENGFLPPGGGGDEPVISSLVMAPDTFPEGDTLVVTLTASGARSLNQVNLQFRGAVLKDTLVAVPEPARELEAEFRIPVAFGTGPDSLLYLDAIVIDAAGIESAPAQDTVFIRDATPPAVQSGASPQNVGSGEPMTIQVTASDNRGLAAIGYVVTDQATGDTVVPLYTEALTGSPLSFEDSYTVTGPAIDPTTLEVHAFAIDRNALGAVSATREVALEDHLGPSIAILETTPDSTVPLGDSIQVRVQVDDPSGISQLIFIGLAERGDTLLGTDTVVVRYDQFTINFPRPGEDEVPESVIRAPMLGSPDDSTSEPLTIVVLAEDGFGNISEVTKNMYVGGPDVSLIYPTQDVAFGVSQSFEVRVRISDSQGIDSAKVFLGGAMNQTLTLPLPPRTDTPFVSVQTINLPATEGTVTLSARAWNPEEVGGQTKTITIDVQSDPPADVDPPVVSVVAEMLNPVASQPRMEMKDILRITVTARDEGSAGLQAVGLKIIASRSGTQHVIEEATPFTASHSLEQHVFAVPLDSLYARFGITGAATLDDLLPEKIDLRIHGFAVDEVDQLACSVGIEEQRACTPSTYSGGGSYEASDTSGLRMGITAVRGHTVLLDNRDATIADIALDEVDERLFLSNITENLVELLELHEDPDQLQFLSPVLVGSQPWGLFVGERIVSSSDEAFLSGLVTAGNPARTLIVGNSGGTNLSLVHLDPDPANVEEVDVVRLQAPNTLLYQFTASFGPAGAEYGAVEYFDFSDRPQFLAQDQLGRIVYSTVDTEAARGTTLRWVHPDPDPLKTNDIPEARFFLTADMVNSDGGGVWSVGNVDNVITYEFTTGNDMVELISHKPGHPDSVLTSGLHVELTDAVAALQSQIDATMTAWGVPERAPLFYPAVFQGSWNLVPSSSGGDGSVTFSDTTFVSASRDGYRIAIGEGGAEPTGRIILWTAEETAIISSEIQITDLISNASERVLGVGLNVDGSLGVARGVEATYFFTPDLRLQGLYQQPEQGGAGAVFHPEHDEITDGGHTDATRTGVAFTGSPVRSIEVVNTFHFNKINELFIRDNVVGPLKAGPPLSTDNAGQGALCVGEDCVVLKLYGITDAGGVVVVNVRRRDLATP